MTVLLMSCFVIGASWAADNISSQRLAMAKDVLSNICKNGFNPEANDGLGGLFINWRYGSKPLLANNGRTLVRDGKVESSQESLHDRLTDLRYLRGLFLYKKYSPSDHTFDNDVAKYTGIVRADFPDGTDERGWVFDEWLSMFALTGDKWYQQAALSAAAALEKKFYHPEVGALYKRNSGDQYGYYKPSEALGQAAALVKAGRGFQNPKWVEEGTRAAKFVIAHAYLPKYHVFLGNMDGVLNDDGKVQDNETILVKESSHGYTITGGTMRLGEIAECAQALTSIGRITADSEILNIARDMLDALSPNNNSIGLWDAQNGGYFYGLVFPGSDYANAGQPSMRTSSKEAGRQLLMCFAFNEGNQAFANRYAQAEKAMLDVLMNRASYRPGHGYLYETTPDWNPLTRKGKVDDFVTTEAMGIGVEALLQPQPR
jgi:hypothetical protein